MISRFGRRPVVAVAVALMLALSGTALGAFASTGSDAGSGSTGHAAHMASMSHGRSGAISKLAFHDAMRKLWEDHITWTRLFIVSFSADLPDLTATTNRLLRNQVDIGDAVRPFYGKA